MFPLVIFHIEFISIKSDHSVGPFGFVIFPKMEVLFCFLKNKTVSLNIFLGGEKKGSKDYFKLSTNEMFYGQRDGSLPSNNRGTLRDMVEILMIESGVWGGFPL